MAEQQVCRNDQTQEEAHLEDDRYTAIQATMLHLIGLIALDDLRIGRQAMHLELLSDSNSLRDDGPDGQISQCHYIYSEESADDSQCSHEHYAQVESISQSATNSPDHDVVGISVQLFLHLLERWLDRIHDYWETSVAIIIILLIIGHTPIYIIGITKRFTIQNANIKTV